MLAKSSHLIFTHDLLLSFVDLLPCMVGIPLKTSRLQWQRLDDVLLNNTFISRVHLPVHGVHFVYTNRESMRCHLLQRKPPDKHVSFLLNYAARSLSLVFFSFLLSTFTLKWLGTITAAPNDSTWRLNGGVTSTSFQDGARRIRKIQIRKPTQTKCWQFQNKLCIYYDREIKKNS